MDGSVRAFLHHLKAERRRSAHTVRSYEHDLALYCRYLREVFGEEADPTAPIRFGCVDTRPGYPAKATPQAPWPAVWPASVLSSSICAETA